MSDLIDSQETLRHIEKIRQGALMMNDIHRASLVIKGMDLCEESVRNQPSAQQEVLACGSGELVQESYSLVKDCISRQAAIDAARDWYEGLICGSFKGLEKRLRALPPAQHERRKGKWIITSEFEDCYYAKCNQCNITQVFYFNKPLTKFCPNCEAMMDGGGDDGNG